MLLQEPEGQYCAVISEKFDRAITDHLAYHECRQALKHSPHRCD